MTNRVVAYVFKGNFTNLGAGFAVMSKSAVKLGNDLSGLDKKGRQMRSGLTTVADGAGKVGLAAAAGFTIAIASAAKFDQSMSKVSAATHESAGNMALLRQAALDAGKATQYSATEAAGAIEQLAKAGVSTADILDGGLNGALDLAAAGSMEVADAAEIAATAMTQFKLSGDQIPHVADLLAAGAGKAQGEVSDMGMALKQAGLVASQTGLSIEETTGALAEFAANGLVGSDAGTSFKTMLQALNPNSDKAADLMAELGIAAYDAQGNFVGMEALAGQLQAALGGLSVEQQNAALKTIFGSDAVRAAAIIFKDGAQGVGEWQDKVNDAGYAADTAARNTDNLIGDLERLGGALETAFIGAGSGSQGGLRSLVQNAEDAVGVFNDMPASVQSSTSALLGLTAVTGGALWFGSKVIGGVASAREALGQLGVEAGRTRTAIADIGTATAAITTVIASADILQAAFDRLADTRIDTASLSRDLEALADGRITDNLDNLFHTFQDIDNGWQAKSNPLSWISSWDPSGFESAQKNIKDLDAALAEAVESGNADMAAAAIENLAPTAEKAGVSAKKLLTLFPEYQTALDNAAVSTNDLSNETSDYGVAARTADGEVEKFNDTIREQRDAAHDTAKSFVGLGDSLEDNKVSLSAWIKSMQDQADALRNFRVNAETAAKKGLREGLIKALEDAGPAGAMRMKQLAGATKEQIGAANRSWQAGQREIKRYTDAVGGVPVSTGTSVGVKTFDAMTAIARLRAALAQVKSKDVNVNVHYRNIGNKLAGMAAGRSADGGTVPKTGLPYADRHPYLLADGERVTSNRYGQSDKAAHILDLVNAGKLTDKMVGYADGGTAGRKPGKAARKDFTVDGTTPDGGFYQVNAGKTVASAVDALTFMGSIVKDLSGDLKTLSREYGDAERAVKRETAARDAIAAKVTDQQAEVDRLTGLYDALSSTIRSGLAADQFAEVEADPWRSSAGGAPSFEEIIRRLNASTKDAEDFTTATGSLTAKGLTGSALESVLAQGLGTASMFANLTPEQLAEYQGSFDKNAAATAAAGDAGGEAVFGPELGKQTELLAAQQAELARANGALVEANRASNRAEQARDRAERQRDRAIDNQKAIRDELSEIRSELAKNRAAKASAARSRK